MFDADPVDGAGDIRALTLGRAKVEFTHGLGMSSPAVSNSTAFQHLAIVVSSLDDAIQRLEAVSGWTPISRAGPERLPAASGGVSAFKFRDPEGHPLEFLAFSRGAVPPVWRPSKGLFLGIDHSAITVADVADSVAFYEGLGFKVSSRQLNRGIEQDRMDDVDGAVVDVVGLTPHNGSTPHLELLHYRQPATITGQLDSNDVLATHVLLDCDRSESSALLIDPDGHRLLAR